ncbi:hypothetical protein K1T71_004888 [Dendrolimus kikuchii]|uniref:Uncharacterized protein n=1 Tax=Dendrolimus kikuchii TaxID=765133 RepID=A0ACC1D5F7_9NEOP|nr:hypothetical protein K1T71_004888 [Dendrolimus kikuchii]
MYRANFTTDIRYIAGKDNVIADSLSRIHEIKLPLDYQSLARDQEADEELQTLLKEGSSLKLEKRRMASTDCEVFCDVSASPRPFITRPFRKQIFDTLHNLSHPGVKATVRLLSQRYVWPGIRKDCRQWAKHCQECQRSKVTRHTAAPLAAFKTPSGRFQHIHCDIIGPLPISSGNKYCLTIVDRVTRWPEALPLQDITAETCAAALTAGWIARFGCPERITTDRGRQFESQTFKELAALIGAAHHPTTSYHPAANGLVERLHRQLKAAIVCHTDSNWTEVLPWVLLGIRSAWKDDLQASTAELVYGEPLRLPGQFLTMGPDEPVDTNSIVSRLRSHMRKLTPQPTSWDTSLHKPFYVPKDLNTATHVFLRQGPVKRPLQPPYQGPYKVVRHDVKTFDIDVNGKTQRVTIDRLKPAYMAKEDTGNLEDKPAEHPATEHESPVKKTRSGRTIPDCSTHVLLRSWYHSTPCSFNRAIALYCTDAICPPNFLESAYDSFLYFLYESTNVIDIKINSDHSMLSNSIVLFYFCTIINNYICQNLQNPIKRGARRSIQPTLVVLFLLICLVFSVPSHIERLKAISEECLRISVVHFVERQVEPYSEAPCTRMQTSFQNWRPKLLQCYSEVCQTQTKLNRCDVKAVTIAYGHLQHPRCYKCDAALLRITGTRSLMPKHNIRLLWRHTLDQGWSPSSRANALPPGCGLFCRLLRQAARPQGFNILYCTKMLHKIKNINIHVQVQSAVLSPMTISSRKPLDGTVLLSEQRCSLSRNKLWRYANRWYLLDCMTTTPGLEYATITALCCVLALVTRFQSPLREQQRICSTFGTTTTNSAPMSFISILPLSVCKFSIISTTSIPINITLNYLSLVTNNVLPERASTTCTSHQRQIGNEQSIFFCTGSS